MQVGVTAFESDDVGHTWQALAGTSQWHEVAFAVFDPSAVRFIVKLLLNSLID
jgi:hypothetical protein